MSEQLRNHDCRPEDLRLLDETPEHGIWQCKICFSHRVVVKRGIKQGARREALKQQRARIEERLREWGKRTIYNI